MFHEQIILGQWEEISRLHASELEGHQVEIRVLDRKPALGKSRPISAGMFPGLSNVDEADFKEAEWSDARGLEI